jgi:hypothetical protein
LNSFLAWLIRSSVMSAVSLSSGMKKVPKYVLELDAEGHTSIFVNFNVLHCYSRPMISVQALESAWPPFSNLGFCSSLHSVNTSQPKTSKMRDDKLGSSNQFSAAEKDAGRVIHIVGLEERERCSLVEVLGST